MHWIEPIKEQLNRLERRFEQLSAPGPATVVAQATQISSIISSSII